MADIPGLPADVYFGDVGNPLPAFPPLGASDEDTEDQPLSDDERDSLIAVLGFDPRELDDDAPPTTNTLVNNHSYACLLIDVPDMLSKVIMEQGDAIPDKDLADNEREKCPHVTVLYGLKDNDMRDVADTVSNFGPITITLGDTTLFEGLVGRESVYDVVKIDVESGDLHRLQQLVDSRHEAVNKFPDYKPHITVAYVEKGKGKLYTNDMLKGAKFTVTTVRYHTTDNRETIIPLTDGSAFTHRSSLPPDNHPQPPVLP